VEVRYERVENAGHATSRNGGSPRSFAEIWTMSLDIRNLVFRILNSSCICHFLF